MRQTSAIIPYHSKVELSLEDLCWSGMRNAIHIFHWLNTKTSEVHTPLNRKQGEDKGTRHLTHMVPRVTMVRLQLRNPSALLHASAKQGYRLIDTCVAGCYAALAAAPLWRLLQNATGQRIALTHTAPAHLVLHTTAEQQLYPVMHQHTLDQMHTHFAQCYMQVQTRELSNGAVQLFAYTTGRLEAAGIRAVFLHVQANGCVEAEVDGVDKPQCDDLITTLAEAMGGIVTTYAAPTMKGLGLNLCEVGASGSSHHVRF